jgi:cytochrome c553
LKISTSGYTAAEFLYKFSSALHMLLQPATEGEVPKKTHWSGCTSFHPERKQIMKTSKLVTLVMTIAAGLFILIPNLSWAGDEGSTLYKAKCAMCHGADATGKPAAKIPGLVSDEARKASDDELVKTVTDKPKHPAMVKSMARDQVKMVLSYIRSLQK